MKNLPPKVLLAALVLAVPLVVISSGLISFFLYQAGYSLFVWAILPFLGSLLIVLVLGVVLGRAASNRGTRNDV